METIGSPLLLVLSQGRVRGAGGKDKVVVPLLGSALEGHRPGSRVNARQLPQHQSCGTEIVLVQERRGFGEGGVQGRADEGYSDLGVLLRVNKDEVRHLLQGTVPNDGLTERRAKGAGRTTRSYGRGLGIR